MAEFEDNLLNADHAQVLARQVVAIGMHRAVFSEIVGAPNGGACFPDPVLRLK